MNCNHAPKRGEDGHCASMPCPNYVGKCRRHNLLGRAISSSEPCSREAAWPQIERRQQPERRTLIRRSLDPFAAGVLRGEISPLMGEIVEVES